MPNEEINVHELLTQWIQDEETISSFIGKLYTVLPNITSLYNP